MAYAWPLLIASQLEQAESLLDDAGRMAGEDTRLLGEIAAAQAYAAQIRGDEPRLVERSEQALAWLPEASRVARGLVALTLGLAYWHSGRLEDAERAWQIALPAARKTGNRYAIVTAQIFQARSLAVRGQLHLAETSLRQILETAPRLPALALASFDLGTIYYEWNDLDRAGQFIQTGLEDARRSGNVEFQMSGFGLLARLRLAQGDPAGALQALRQSRQLNSSSHAPLRAEARLNALQLELALAQGQVEQAAEWSQVLPDDVDLHPFYRFLGLAKARLQIAQGRKKEAAEILQERFSRAVQSGWGYGALAARILQALAATEPSAALEFMTDAVRRGLPDGYVRTFVEAGEGIVSLLVQVARQGVAPEYVGQILAAMKAGPRQHGKPISSQAGAPHPSAGEAMIEPEFQQTNDKLVEPLSDRELEVLRLVVAGLSNREIAAKLFVSPGTAKTHIHNICGKLGVRNRTEATGRAKELGLV
jgi:LuxR family maltose regulon positive regulatory protein